MIGTVEQSHSPHGQEERYGKMKWGPVITLNYNTFNDLRTALDDLMIAPRPYSRRLHYFPLALSWGPSLYHEGLWGNNELQIISKWAGSECRMTSRFSVLLTGPMGLRWGGARGANS